MEYKTLESWFIRRHKYLVLDSKSPRGIIWDSMTSPKVFEVTDFNFNYSNVAVSSRYLFFPVLITGAGWDPDHWIFHVRNAVTGEWVQTYRIKSGSYRIQHPFVFKGTRGGERGEKYLFFHSDYQISRITIGDKIPLEGDGGAAEQSEGEKHTDKLRLSIKDFGQVGDKLYTLENQRVIIWDPETLKSLRSIHVGNASVVFPVPFKLNPQVQLEAQDTSLLALNTGMDLVDAEARAEREGNEVTTGKSKPLLRTFGQTIGLWFWSDGKILEKSGPDVTGEKAYTVLDSDWNELWKLETHGKVHYRPYESGFLIVFDSNTSTIAIRRNDGKGPEKQDSVCHDILKMKGPFGIGRVEEIPLSKKEQDQDTERFSNFIFSVSPLPKDLAGVIGKFI